MKNDFLKYILVAIGILLLGGCMPDRGDRQAMIREAVDKRLESYKMNRLKNCRKELIEAATKEVDSLLIERARRMKNNLEKPIIPDKPDKPEIMSPLDSAPVRPILQDTLIPSN